MAEAFCHQTTTLSRRFDGRARRLLLRMNAIRLPMDQKATFWLCIATQKRMDYFFRFSRQSPRRIELKRAWGLS